MTEKIPNSGLQPDQVRDYRLLMQRWLDLVNGIPTLSFSVYGEYGGYPLMVVESERRDPLRPSVYLSAGIHGDEPAAVEGSRKAPQITAQLALMRGHRYDVAVSLHEDYDARGFYLYEIAAKRPHWGESLCSECASIFPPDDRRKIDGHTSRNGLIRRKVTAEMMKGHPEAFRLHFRHADHTFTLESPSEESLSTRVLLHKGFLEAIVKKIKTQGGIGKKNV